MCKWQPTVVRSKQNSVYNIHSMQWKGRTHHVSCCLYPALLSTCPPNMRSLINFQLRNDICWSDLHNLSDVKQYERWNELIGRNARKIWSNTPLSTRLPLSDLAMETRELQAESLTIMAHLLHIIGVTTE
jgi:hypothetical protein